jgi:plastocyanin
MRRRIAVAALVAGGVTLVAGCGGGGSDSATSTATSTADVTTTSGSGSGTLAGTVGPGFEISMDKSTTAAGSYTLTVDDQASSHNFHFTGPGGVDVKTEVAEVGKKTFTVKLQPGTYTFVCDPHSSSMNGTLTVT